MNRRLNPELFSPHTTPQETASSGASMVLGRQLEQDLKETKKRVSHLESLLEVVQSQLKTLHQQAEKKTETLTKTVHQLEHELREQNLTTQRKIDALQGRLKEQRIMEGQMESMIERFNSNIMQFENKLAVLQKVISEKDMTLMTYRNIIEQIVDEVEKLKSRSGSHRQPGL